MILGTTPLSPVPTTIKKMLVERTPTCSLNHKKNIFKVKDWMSSLISFVYVQAYFC